ncbi:TPA: hypothetical protein SMR96_000985 [Proteus mirabilis]|nr:macro domain-containing protein [Proteus mirabilis]ELA7948668.1 hypothetical protein [Proteus mirabilis]MBG3049045.1 hypothetical protein [Proteus mirabilis]MBI6269147.1 hypothetical protein [Proteus mirabilis]MDL2092289.1 DUF6430 domain-containing protein [Proteus mirabilis]MDL2107717.1 DUF6430 domain-containing protein [Proteus mirabilis]
MYFFIRKLLYVIGLLSSTLTIIGFSNKNYTNYISDNYLYILVFIIIASLYLSRERNSININISPKVKLTIKYNDIFSEKGIVIIPVNDYFDTLVDDEIISRNTLHGKFINKFYSDDINQLNNQIKKELRNHHGEKIPSRKHGNKVRYPLGTTIKIRRDDQVFFL